MFKTLIKLPENTLYLRPSGLANVLQCPASYHLERPPAIRLASALGTAEHAHTESEYKKKEYTTRYLQYIKSLDCDTEQMELKLEAPLTAVLGLKGTMDFIGTKGTNCFIGDLKTGKTRVVAKNNKQLLAYAYLVRHHETFGKYTLFIGQHDRISKWAVGNEELDAFEKEIKQINVEIPYFNAGNHCFKCFKAGICPIGSKLWLDATKLIESYPPEKLIKLRNVFDSLGVMKYQLAQKVRDHETEKYFDKE